MIPSLATVLATGGVSGLLMWAASDRDDALARAVYVLSLALMGAGVYLWRVP